MPTLGDISSYAYFLDASAALLTITPNLSSSSNNNESHENETQENHISYLLGISSSAGLGSESLTQISRASLHDILSCLPVSPSPASTTSTGTNTSTAKSTGTTLHSITHALLTLLTRAQGNDRILLPLLDTLSYILDMRLLHSILSPTPSPPTSTFPAHSLLSALQPSHQKPPSIPKLLSIIPIYRTLSTIPSFQKPVLEKLLHMLGTSANGRVRMAVAETLWVITGDGGLRGVHWGGGKEGREERRACVEGMRERILGVS